MDRLDRKDRLVLKVLQALRDPKALRAHAVALVSAEPRVALGLKAARVLMALPALMERNQILRRGNQEVISVLVPATTTRAWWIAQLRLADWKLSTTASGVLFAPLVSPQHQRPWLVGGLDSRRAVSRGGVVEGKEASGSPG